MKNFVLLFALFWSSVFSLKLSDENGVVLEEVAFPTTKLEDLESLKNFVQLVSDHHLNISALFYKIEATETKKLEIALALTFSLQKKQVTESTLNEEIAQKFLNVARNDNLAARVILSRKNESSIWTNTFDALPVTNIHKFETDFASRRFGFGSKDRNYVSHRTFFVNRENGKNETVKVIWGNLDVKVVDVHNFTSEEIEESKKLFAKAYIAYTFNNFGQAVVAMFNRSFPGQQWQILSTAGHNSYIKAKKMITFVLFRTKYLIYSI